MSDKFKEEIKSKGARLFAFLKELSKLKIKSVFDLENYEDVIYLHEIPTDRGFFCIAKETTNPKTDIWIEAKKVKRVNPPELPSELREWIDVSIIKKSSAVPSLNQQKVEMIKRMNEDGEEVSETIVHALNDFPDVKSKWESYYTNKWKPWSEKDKEDLKYEKLYKRLYSIYKNQLQLSETYETLMAFGLLRWNREKKPVKRHIVVTKVNISLDSNTGKILIGVPSETGTQLKLEQDMIPPEKSLPPEKLLMIENDLESIGEEVWDNVQLKNTIRQWGNQFSSDCTVSDDIVLNKEAQSEAYLDFCPAVIHRKKSDMAFVKMFQDIENQIETSSTLNENIETLVNIKEDEDASYNFDKEGGDVDLKDIFFPLPTNNEQLQIVRKLESSNGVLVKGPPGTGKSHTIANLICHLLASGDRVLVTSHTTRALKVLHDKIPREMQPLCVSVLGEDLASFRALENSVQGILSKYQECDGVNYNYDRVIKKISNMLHLNREKISELKKELIKLRESDIQEYNDLENYQGKLGAISRQISEDTHKYSWLEDDILEKPVAIEDGVVEKLIQLINEIDHHEESIVDKIDFTVINLLKPSEFKSLTEVRINSTLPDIRKNIVYSYNLLSKQQRDKIKEVLISNSTVIKFKYEWVDDAKNDIFSGRDQKWMELLSTTQKELAVINNYEREVFDYEISGIDGRSMKSMQVHCLRIKQLLENGKKPGLFSTSDIKEAAYIYKVVKVDEHPCKDIETLERLQSKLHICQSLEKLENYWQGLSCVPKGNVAIKVAEYSDFCEPLEKMIASFKEIELLRKESFSFREPRWDNLNDLSDHIKVLNYIDNQEDVNATNQKLDEYNSFVTDLCSKYSLDCFNNMKISIRNKDVEGYLVAYNQIERYKDLSLKVKEKDKLIKSIRSIAPKFGELLKHRNFEEGWESRLKSFNEACEWKYAVIWLKKLDKAQSFNKISQALEIEIKREQTLIAKLASELSWKECFKNLKENQRQHLIAWANAVKRIGKGSGKWANKHRKDARDHMKECRTAIPAWIMPIHRVVENIKIQPGIYDTIIVDEASQSGPEALFLQYIAKKIIVVGDDKQIAPESVGQDRAQVNVIREKFISDLPLKNEISLDSSFFDYTRIKFNAHVTLREHFRCMPEIIQFSNNLCYQSEPLIPLRQFGGDKITPVVDTVYVSGGYISGVPTKQINISEANKIVERIEALTTDEKFNGKTIGVISLKGTAQARYIENLLMERLDEKVIEERQIICGDAYAFQGDERDLIFVSMVSSNIGKNNENIRIGLLSKASDERRFNVAASRARDQLVLFHSVGLNDLNSNCLRYQLLKYCQNPKIEQETIGNLNIDELRKTASNVDRSIVNAVRPFDSWFEIDVFFKIHDRGFRVLPQFQIAGKSIDLVVEGMQGKIAVECDGDYWHGPAQYAADLERQRQLERCGFKFWRIRESTFYADQDDSLLSLWTLLDSLKVNSSSISPLEKTNIEVSNYDSGNSDFVEDELRDEYYDSIATEPVSIKTMTPVEIVYHQGTLILRAKNSELLILQHHVKTLHSISQGSEFTQYFLKEALLNSTARKLFEAWLRKDSTVWPRIYSTIKDQYNEEDFKFLEESEGELRDEYDDSIATEPVSIKTMRPVEIVYHQGTLILRAKNSELLILQHHVKTLHSISQGSEFTQYFLKEALLNSTARKLFEAWLRKDSTVWPRIYSTIKDQYNEEDFKFLEESKEEVVGITYQEKSNKDLSPTETPERESVMSGNFDPRTASAKEIDHRIIDICNREAPVVVRRLYKLLISDSVIGRMGGNVKSILNKRLYALKRKGDLKVEKEMGRKSILDEVAYLPNQDSITLRPRGERLIDEIPILELAEALKLSKHIKDEEGMFRFTLERLDLVRLTEPVKARLLLAKELVKDNDLETAENGGPLAIPKFAATQSIAVDDEAVELVDFVLKVSEATWFQISTNESLPPFFKKLSYSLGRLKKAEGCPSGKQAYWGIKVLEEALKQNDLPSGVELDVNLEDIMNLIGKYQSKFQK